jgi:hypothetical protein
MLFNAIVCPSFQNIDIVKHGVSGEDKDRYKCRNVECKRCTFILNYTYQGHLPEVKEKIISIWLQLNIKRGMGMLPVHRLEACSTI